jgi:hypothetical protein
VWSLKLVLRPAHPRRIDDEAARLRVLEKRRHEPRRERIGRRDDRRGVIGDQDAEDASVEGPRRLTRFDGRRRRLPEARIDEAVARHARREDPRADAAPPPLRVRDE